MGQERGMSFPKKGKSFPKKGKSFPKRDGGGGSEFSLDDQVFAMKIALALKVRTEGSKLARKVGCRLDGCERAHCQKLDLRTVRALRPTPGGIGSAF
jgi:hypothetical protein